MLTSYRRSQLAQLQNMRVSCLHGMFALFVLVHTICKCKHWSKVQIAAKFTQSCLFQQSTHVHVCAGLKWHEENQANCISCQTCRFNNVCLNHTTLNIQYYRGETDWPLFYDILGTPHVQFPADFLNTGVPTRCLLFDLHLHGINRVEVHY